MYHRVLRPFIRALTGPSIPHTLSRRWMGMIDKRGVMKRMYRDVDYRKEPSGYSVLLDNRPLNTPKGQKLLLPSEGLAAVIAQEWSQQGEEIRRNFMHLNSLACTVLDNPTRESDGDRVENVLKMLQAEPVCLWTSQPEDFAKLQKERWGSLLDWFNKFYGVSLTPSIDKLLFEIPATSLSRLREILSEKDNWRLVGLQFGTDACRSLVIVSAMLEGVISCEQAVADSLLETEFQCEVWGRVEWGHGVEEAELLNRLSAAAVFIKACDY